ncbi:glycosyltransferase family 4 protein [Sulfitobacter aestuariivivens]|uniref:Glycosyltransferase family 4 protein n=1 Tax=Sulfitobacter aestuariivivens TaxID=2766981 RepID=A0A927D3F7_9RHOB|nr:glycosyltransferase family 4 protein [Sulfitobacter aestuariivivens]MBD3663598.1 glycosyltransferase family 4 protein [Sulfitobacter aestuariivivens]
MTPVDIRTVQVIAPNFKRRISGVTSTVIRLVPVQAKNIAIAASGPVLPSHVPQVPLRSLLTMPRRGPGGARVWHARRNLEMIGGLALKFLLGKKLKLIFTSASQREHTGLTRWLINQMDAVVATSDKSASYLQVPAQVIMHGIDANDYKPVADRAALRGDLGLPDGKLIGCFGRIRAQKGTDAFVDAMIKVLPDHPDFNALVMGRATAQHEAFLTDLKARVSDAGLSDRIYFRDEVHGDTLAAHFQALDLYVAPQRWEGFGLTPIEAMATGCPVVATRVGAFEKLVKDGETGLLAPPDDIPALSSAVDDALSDRERLSLWREASRAHVLQDYTLEREAAELIALYRRLLETT